MSKLGTGIAPGALNTNYIPALDGVRGYAILMVIGYHYFAFNEWTKYGWMGVDFFFVLSGYLITCQLIKKADSPNYFSNFYRNRILRIWPLYYLFLVAFYITIYFLVSPATSGNFQYYKMNAWAFAIMAQNFLLMITGVPDQPHIAHLWSLAVEEQFYLIWPMLLFLLPKKNINLLIWVLLIPLVICVRCYQYLYSPGYYGIYFNTFCRFDSFLIGASVFFFSRNLKISQKVGYRITWILVAIIAAFILAKRGDYNRSSVFFETIGYTVIAVVPALIIFLIIFNKDKLTTNFFSWKPIVQLGKLSYGIYIIHYPLYHFLVHFWNNKVPYFANNFPQLNSFICAFTCFTLTYFFSWISYRYFESFFLKFKV